MTASALPDPASLACDCQTVAPLDLGDVTGLGIHAASSHLRRKLALLLLTHDLPVIADGHSFVVPAQAFGSLESVLTAFSSSERPDLLAAPHSGGQTDAWQVAPLQDWVRRLNSRWFAQASQQLRFHFQPIVELASGRVYGYEALVRAQWQGELLGAAPLLQAAAAHGEARAFDAHARRMALRQGYPQLQPDQTLFINFAPGVVYNPDICLQTTFQTCRELGADFSRLSFEVVESESFPDIKLLKHILERYRAEGAQVVLDDLGAGHTSLTYLAQLRPDIVKLDRALISGLGEGDPRLPLVKALVDYAHDLGIRVVAEGIETEDELRTVAALGADYAQGYLLGRPNETARGLAPEAAGFWAQASS